MNPLRSAQGVDLSDFASPYFSTTLVDIDLHHLSPGIAGTISLTQVRHICQSLSVGPHRGLRQQSTLGPAIG